VAASFGLRKLPDYLAAVPAARQRPAEGRFVTGRDGVVGYAEVNPDYTRRPEPEELLPVLHSMAVSRAA